MDGVGLQAQPQVGSGRLQAGNQKATRSAAEAPGPGSFHSDSTPTAPAPFVGRGPRPGPGPGQHLPAEGGGAFPAPERAAGAGAEAAAVAAEPEVEHSKFRELWQGPAERREESPERRLLASVWERGGGAWAWGPPGAEPAAVGEIEREPLRFLELFEFSVLRAAGGAGPRRCPKSSDWTRKGAIVPSQGDYKVVLAGW